MNDLTNSLVSPSSSSLSRHMKRALIIGQFFLIIFVYHMLKDLKDTLVVTASDAGAQVIPFLKIWVILPFAILASYCFTKIYQKVGRTHTLYIFVGGLISAYLFFAFVLYPLREELYLSSLSSYLTAHLPVGCKGFVAMVSYWIYTFFYLAAELWSMMILTILFWGYLNDNTSPDEAKSFYPLCVFAGNCAGILSGQVSRYLCHSLMDVLSWGETLQLMCSAVALCGIGIMVISKQLSRGEAVSFSFRKKNKTYVSFRESLRCIFRSQPLLCIATLVVGFALTSNLVEVSWKETIKEVHPSPQAYNAYVNQLTSMIGVGAVIFSLLSRHIFRFFSWLGVAIITPILLFITSFAFFAAMQMPRESLAYFASYFSMDALYLAMTLGSVYYVLALVAKYTIFDMCKEMAFLSIDASQRMRAKSVIDSIGSRLGKSGSSCLYQVLLIMFGSTAGHIPIVGATAVFMIGLSIVATVKLGRHVDKGKEGMLEAA